MAKTKDCAVPASLPLYLHGTKALQEVKPVKKGLYPEKTWANPAFWPDCGFQQA
jgi:hypothetical protein